MSYIWFLKQGGDVGNSPALVKALGRVVRKHDPKHIKFGFIMAFSDAELKAQCVEYQSFLCFLLCLFTSFIWEGVLWKFYSEVVLKAAKVSDINNTFWYLGPRLLRKPRCEHSVFIPLCGSCSFALVLKLKFKTTTGLKTVGL